MYICLCNAVTEQSVRDACDSGAESLADLQSGLGVATGCGQCAEAACSLLEGKEAIPPGCAPVASGTANIRRAR